VFKIGYVSGHDTAAPIVTEMLEKFPGPTNPKYPICPSADI